MERDYEEPLDAEQHWTAEMVEDALDHPVEWELTEGALAHPVEWGLRVDRLPHIWCPGCGIGVSVACFVEALKEAGADLLERLHEAGHRDADAAARTPDVREAVDPQPPLHRMGESAFRYLPLHRMVQGVLHHLGRPVLLGVQWLLVVSVHHLSLAVTCPPEGS